MDYHLFLDRAAIDGKLVEVRTTNGEAIQAYPLYLDEAYEDLGYIFETLEGSLTGIFFADIKSAKTVERSKEAAS